MNTASSLPLGPRSAGALHGDTAVQVLKWAASIVQILGYGATAFGLTPLNLYFFLVGILGWFIVGFFWRDRAIMLIHVIALGAMVAGLLSG